MAEFNELIKNFERIRDYMKDFFIYGFKVRGEYTGKSTRTYDNEKRRIESYLGDYMNYKQTSKGKAVSVLVDSNSIFHNPLYATWKAKSFTDKDIMLHFYLIELLREGKENTAEGLCTDISIIFGEELDPQVIRLKLKEYANRGILSAFKLGKELYYKLSAPMTIEKGRIYDSLVDSFAFFQEAAPFGFIGSTLLDRERTKNKYFSFKHHFLMHTLEDGVLLDILDAMKEQRTITFINRTRRQPLETTVTGIPLKIMVSTGTGRRYVCIYHPKTRRYNNMRLDNIRQVEALDAAPNYEQLKDSLHKALPQCWGVTFGGKTRMEDIQLKLYIDEKREAFILNRLKREGRGGKLKKIDANTFLYSGHFYDTNEMLPWIKTFIGRIMDIQGSNKIVISKLKRNINSMHKMYCTIESGKEGE